MGQRQIGSVIGLLRFATSVWLIGLVAWPAQAAFTSLYVFGDGTSTTTNGPGGPSFYGRRYCNGRVWVELLAQQQGLAYDPVKNWSYYGHFSRNLVVNVNAFAAPPDAHTALFVIWVNNADFVYGMNYPYGTNLALWTNAINQSLTNHLRAVTNLYAKGARTLVMPTAVDLTQIPYYANYAAPNKRFVRQRVMDFNIAFVNSLRQTEAALPGLKVFVPDLFTLLDNIIARPADYGFTNALLNGQIVDALGDPALKDRSLNGAGTNYIFWDYLDPTALGQAWIAETVQQLISPPRIAALTVRAGQVRLDLVNLPVGREGYVVSRAVSGNWRAEAAIESRDTTQTILLPTRGRARYYRLQFPFGWAWP